MTSLETHCSIAAKYGYVKSSVRIHNYAAAIRLHFFIEMIVCCSAFFLYFMLFSDLHL